MGRVLSTLAYSVCITKANKRLSRSEKKGEMKGKQVVKMSVVYVYRTIVADIRFKTWLKSKVR